MKEEIDIFNSAKHNQDHHIQQKREPLEETLRRVLREELKENKK